MRLPFAVLVALLILAALLVLPRPPVATALETHHFPSSRHDATSSIRAQAAERASTDMGEVAEPQGRMPRGRRAWGQHQERDQAGRVVREKTLGRLQEAQDSRWGAITYKNDPVSRLVEASQSRLHEYFEYDEADSLLRWVEGLPSNSKEPTILGPDEPRKPKHPTRDEKAKLGPGNRLLQRGNTSYEYDVRGRRTKKLVEGVGTTEYAWDGRERLRRVRLPDGTEARYAYDGFGRRVEKQLIRPDGTDRKTTFLWDGEVLALERDTERGTRVFVHEPGTFEPVLQQEQGEVFLTVNDHLGMPKELVSPDGLVVWAAAHAAFGKVIGCCSGDHRQNPGRC